MSYSPCSDHPAAGAIKDYCPDGSQPALEVRCAACNRLLGTTPNPRHRSKLCGIQPEIREFILKVQKVSDEVEAINLIEQVFQIYPKVDRVAIATYFQRRMVPE